MSKASFEFDEAVKGLRERIENWRQTRTRRGVMPQELWDEAVKLAQVYGVFTTKTALRISYYSLKNRLHGNAPKRPYRKSSNNDFVEVKLPEQNILASYHHHVTIEAGNIGGDKLAIHLPSTTVLDLKNIARIFLRH